MALVGAPGQTMHGFGVNTSIGEFIGEMQRILMDRPIVDETGLTGVYNIQIAFTREDPDVLGMTELPETAPPNLLEALQQQLGLKLKGTKASVDVIVIDHAELPEANEAGEGEARDGMGAGQTQEVRCGCYTSLRSENTNYSGATMRMRLSDLDFAGNAVRRGDRRRL